MWRPQRSVVKRRGSVRSEIRIIATKRNKKQLIKQSVFKIAFPLTISGLLLFPLIVFYVLMRTIITFSKKNHPLKNHHDISGLIS